MQAGGRHGVTTAGTSMGHPRGDGGARQCRGGRAERAADRSDDADHDPTNEKPIRSSGRRPLTSWRPAAPRSTDSERR